MQNFMKTAISEARKGMHAHHGGPFGAVIVKKGKIISRAHNTVLKNKDPTQHAEMNAIRSAAKKLKKFDLSGCEIFATSEPCPMCFTAIHWARIGKAHYGATLKDSEKAGFHELHITDFLLKKMGRSKVKLVQDKLKNECRELFKEYKKMRGKKY